MARQFTPAPDCTSTPRSSSRAEAAREPRRKICCENAFLCLLYVVRSAIKTHRVLCAIEYSKSRPPISISRLTHRSRVNQVLHPLFQRPGENFPFVGCAIRRSHRAAIRWIGAKCSLDMRMTEKGQRYGCHQEGLDRVARRDQVIVFIKGRTVDKLSPLNPIDRDRALW